METLMIVKPSVEIWKQKDYVEHIAKCARVCYKSEKVNDDKLVENLKNKEHLSMFRHYSVYWLVPIKEIDKLLIDVSTIFNLFSSEYCQMSVDKKYYYFVTNEQYYLEHYADLRYLDRFLVKEDDFINSSSTGREMRRITIKCVTQISTSRELNRVSPNNIAEQSTRYVNFNKKGGSICAPHWMLNEVPADCVEINRYDLNTFEDYQNCPLKTYLTSCFNSFEDYNNLLINGLLTPQDARGVLPLDTTTECVYTYSIKEWKHIIALRFYGTTGKPHPNAKIIAGMIRDKINELGYML